MRRDLNNVHLFDWSPMAHFLSARLSWGYLSGPQAELLPSLMNQSTKKVALALGVTSVAASMGGNVVQAGPALQSLNNITNTANSPSTTPTASPSVLMAFSMLQLFPSQEHRSLTPASELVLLLSLRASQTEVSAASRLLKL